MLLLLYSKINRNHVLGSLKSRHNIDNYIHHSLLFVLIFYHRFIWFYIFIFLSQHLLNKFKFNKDLSRYQHYFTKHKTILNIIFICLFISIFFIDFNSYWVYRNLSLNPNDLHPALALLLLIFTRFSIILPIAIVSLLFISLNDSHIPKSYILFCIFILPLYNMANVFLSIFNYNLS